jgi:hypothetical protein
MNILSKDPAINVDLIVSGDEYDYISKYIDLTVEPINLPSIILKPHYKSIIPLNSGLSKKYLRQYKWIQIQKRNMVYL